MYVPRDVTTGRTLLCFFFFNDTATTEIYTLSLHDALPISLIGQYTKNGEARWRWGAEQGEPQDIAYWLHRDCWYHVRVVFIGPEEAEEYTYFAIEPLEENALMMPHVVGQTIFDFIDDWKEADAQIERAS